MSAYIIIAIISYLLFAINGVADKFLLTKVVRQPAVYAFYIGVGSMMAVFLAPFGMHMLYGMKLYIALTAGFVFTYALYFFYSAIQQTSISRVLPIEGGLVPTFTFILAFITQTEILTRNQIIAAGLLVMGAVLISLKKSDGKWTPKALYNATMAAFLFALSFILTKYTYEQTSFISGLVWTRLGLGIGALVMLIPQTVRHDILSAPREAAKKHIFLFYGGHLTGTLGSYLQQYAIAIGSVVIVNAMQGVQFVFILLAGVLLSRYFPKILKEEVSGLILSQKVLAIVLISFGLIILAL